MKRTAAFISIFIILATIIAGTILPASADIIGDPDVITGWYLIGDMVLYDAGPDITTMWGGYEPYFDVVNATDDLINLQVGSDRINYPSYDYAVSDDVATVAFFPGFGGQNNVNMIIGDELTLRLTGSFVDITGGSESAYLYIHFNRDAYYIASYEMEFQYEENNDYTLFRENRDYWNREYFELEAPWPELQNFVLTLHIKSNRSTLPGNLKVIVDHSVRALNTGVDETSYWSGYNAGYSAGVARGETTGYISGYEVGKNEAEADVQGRIEKASQDAYESGLRAATINKGAARYTSWLVAAVGGFFNFEIFPGFSLGGILGVIIAISVAIVFLKYYAGG